MSKFCGYHQNVKFLLLNLKCSCKLLGKNCTNGPVFGETAQIYAVGGWLCYAPSKVGRMSIENNIKTAR